ncbi:hypothetical protein [Saccharicrinis fermentans]|uniref:Uncharacterized protein n=1 Tax=Saccharicrinis fermentans DSM 9555 = JCM 21142 TaxID=869213 RepID=W7XXQ3_9BACT|nr:hypothetical protein [Saccharicrinis fermentans]GAF03250.1 hypothetical protein JCM21142_41917 [Saccharicrinis fermentans DSM 9555 = JCM 21142]
MIGKILSPSTRRHISNIPGFNIRRKLLVIESDDWGSVRMPGVQAFDNLMNAGIDLVSDEGFRFNKYDSLATSDDLSFLLELLSSFKDCTNRPAVLTPVSVMANPNFEQIKENGFNTYSFEPFTETLNRYQGCESSYALWLQGIENRLFVPQFHGREHLNVLPWLRALKSGHKNTLLAFDNQLWGISTAQDPDIGLEYQAAFDFRQVEDLEYQKEVIRTGLDLFEQLLGYRASFFVPPNGPFSKKLEESCVSSGIKFLSTSKVQDEPVGNGKTNKRIHWSGQKSKNGLIYLTRNCFFEPSDSGKDWLIVVYLK